MLRRRYPASTLLRPCPTPAATATSRDVEAATLVAAGLPRLPEPPCLRAVPTTPADRRAARVGCFPLRAAFPVKSAGRHPQLHFRGLLGLHSRYGPQGLLAHLPWTLSQGFGPAGYPTKPLASYQTKPTTICVEPSSTGDSRRRGARFNPGEEPGSSVGWPALGPGSRLSPRPGRRWMDCAAVRRDPELVRGL